MKSLLAMAIGFMTLLAHADCTPAQSKENFITKGDYPIFKTLAEAEVKYNEVYESGRRLKDRAFALPESGTIAIAKNGGIVEIAPAFISALTQQMQTALARGYANFLYYPDLGHAHILLPVEKNVDKKYDMQTPAGLQNLLGDSEIKFLYHTAELFQLRESMTGPLTSDPWLQWRYYSRNFAASLNDSDNLAVLIETKGVYNTVRSIDGHSEKARVYFSASKDGCFPIQVQGKTLHFDIAFE
jgi:hypothetical protein